MDRVAVVVVGFNTRDALRRCLASLGEADRVVVVDNASADGTPDMVEAEFAAVQLIRNGRNVGFGRANNQALDALGADGADLILFLNSDAWAEPGAVRTLAAAMADPGVAAAGGRLVYPDGRTQASTARRLTLARLFGEQFLLDRLSAGRPPFGDYWTTHAIMARHQPGQTHETEQLMGACLMVRPGFRFDEAYPLYCEDTELCDRLRAAGRVVYVPDAVFGHALGGSTSADRWRGVALYNAGKERYLRQTSGPAAAAFAFALNRAGALFRLLLWSVATIATLGRRAGWRRQVGLFARVLTAPIAGPPLRQPAGPVATGSS